jgi:hypothetical protein
VAAHTPDSTDMRDGKFKNSTSVLKTNTAPFKTRRLDWNSQYVFTNATVRIHGQNTSKFSYIQDPNFHGAITSSKVRPIGGNQYKKN